MSMGFVIVIVVAGYIWITKKIAGADIYAQLRRLKIF